MFPHVHIGGIDLSTWRIVVIDGVLLCWALFLLRARHRGFPVGRVLLLLVLALPAGTIGGHLFNRLIPLLFGIGGPDASGLTVLGSIVSVLAFSLLYAKFVIKIEPLLLLDAAAFTFPLSILIGRFGCILNGCCYGTIAPASAGASWLAVLTIPVGSFSPDSMAGRDLAGIPSATLLWNLPLMLMLNALLVLITAEVLYRNRERWRLAPGTVMAAVCTQYAAGRFVLEFFRKDVSVGATPFNPWQLSVLALFFVSAFWLGVSIVRRNRISSSPSEEART